jgi:hypothetical protein
MVFHETASKVYVAEWLPPPRQSFPCGAPNPIKLGNLHHIQWNSSELFFFENNAVNLLLDILLGYGFSMSNCLTREARMILCGLESLEHVAMIPASYLEVRWVGDQGDQGLSCDCFSSRVRLLVAGRNHPAYVDPCDSVTDTSSQLYQPCRRYPFL